MPHAAVYATFDTEPNTLTCRSRCTIMKLVVEVFGAHDLPARRRGGGGVSPFVQVDFGGQCHATAVRPAGDLNPTWNKTLVFAGAANGGRLSDRSIDVAVYHRRASGGKSCLGCVRLFGAAVAPSREEAVLLRCPLDKPGFFAPARGEVALRLYMAPYTSPSNSAAAGCDGAANAPAPNAYSATCATTLDNAASAAGPETVVGGASTQSAPALRTKRPNNKEPPVHVFHSLPAQSSTGSLIYPPPPPAGDPKGAKKAQAATSENAKAAAHLIVDQLEFLYVNVVCARGLPGMDLTLGVDPYVEVRVGNYSGITRHLERNHNPEWNQVFAFSRENLRTDSLEVIVKDRNLIVQDGFVGKVVLPILEVPNLAPPNGPLAPQWYGLRGAKDQWTGGEIKLAAWKGTQTDDAFAGALHAGAHDMVPSAVLATQTKSYYTPRLCYLRCHVIMAQDLVHPDRSRSQPTVFARVELGAQRWETRVAPDRSLSPKWDEDFFLVAAWPFEEPLVITVMDVVSPERHEVLGRLVLPKGAIKVQQLDKKKFKPPPPSWFDLEQQPRSGGSGDGDGGRDRGWRHEFRSKIQLRVYYDAAYNVLDELTAYGSDFQPSARPLRSPPIGVLELGILRATGLPSPARLPNGGRRSADAYCVAKYGQKWIRTRTLLDTASPSWQEQFTFDVFDPCTVLTVAVFNNNQLAGAGESSRRDASDAPLGKVRVRVSTLASGCTYEHPYTLFVVQPGRLLRCGELRLAVRFTHTAWARMMALYLRPPLPNQHFAKPIPAHLAAELRRHAVDVVASRLARAEPPLRPEAVRYVLRDPRAHPSPAVPERHGAYSLRKYHAACARLRGVVAPAGELARWLRGVRDWESPATTVLVLLVFLTLTWRPFMVLPTFFLYLFAVGVWNFRWRPVRPEQMEHYADGVPPAMLEEEFDAGPASGTPPEIVGYRYWALRGMAMRVQELVGDVAGQAERVQALLEWRDGRATVIALVAVFALAAVLYAVPIRAVVAVAGVYWMRHPVLRRKRKVPSPLASFFRRLPSNADVML